MSVKDKSSLDTFPLCGWDIGVVRHDKAIILRPHYLGSFSDSPEHPQIAQTFVFPTSIARELAEKLLALSDQLESDATPIPDTMKN